MPQYPNNYNVKNTSCNTENCKRCRNKYSCSQYINYLETIAQLPIGTSSSVPLNTQLISGSNDSLVEVVVNKFLILENRYKILQESIDILNNKLSKLDGFIEMIETHGAQSSNVEQGGKDEKILVEKRSKGFLGIGAKSEWVEEDLNNKE